MQTGDDGQSHLQPTTAAEAGAVTNHEPPPQAQLVMGYETNPSGSPMGTGSACHTGYSQPRPTVALSTGRIETDEYMLEEASHLSAVSQEYEAASQAVWSQEQEGGAAAGEAGVAVADGEDDGSAAAAVALMDMSAGAAEGEARAAAGNSEGEAAAGVAVQELAFAAMVERKVSAARISTAGTEHAEAVGGAGRVSDGATAMQRSQLEEVLSTGGYSLYSAAAVEAELLMSDEDMTESLEALEVRYHMP